MFARCSLIVILLSPLLAAPALGAPWHDELAKRLELPVEPLEVAGHAAFLLLPEASQRAEEMQPWVMYAPALPGYPDQHERWMHQQFVKAGVAVAGVDMGEAYGSPRGQEGMTRLYELLVKERGFASRPCLLGRSRGGLWAASWGGRHPDKVSGLAGIYPVFDLRSYPGLEKAATAYEMSPAELEQSLAQLNPIEQAASLAKARVPVFIIHGALDELVPLERNSAELAARYTRAGAEADIELEVVPDQGHNFWPGFFRSQKLVDFVIARAKAGAQPSQPGAGSPASSTK